MKTTNDPIADMLTRVRNAAAIGKPEVNIPYSKLKHGIASILEREGFVGKVTKVEPDKPDKAGSDSVGKVKQSYTMLRIGLRYRDNKKSVITSIKRISKPGLRIYKGSTELPVVLNHLGLAILSTSHGLMTNKDAKKQGVGGEIICEIY